MSPPDDASSFQKDLEMVEGLPEEQRWERRRDSLVASIAEARQELARGEVRRGTVDDLMADIDERLQV